MPFRGKLLKNEAGPSGPTSSSTLIQGHAPCLSGRRPSCAPFWWLRVPLPSSTAALRTSMAPSNLKGIIEELVNIDQRLSALEAKFDSFSNEQKDSERDAPRSTMQRRVCAVCSAKFACPASFRGQAPTCRGCRPATHAPVQCAAEWSRQQQA